MARSFLWLAEVYFTCAYEIQLQTTESIVQYINFMVTIEKRIWLDQAYDSPSAKDL